MRTSLIVTTYNWPEALALCLASVARQRRLPDEVIVADDGSRDETAVCVRRLAAAFPVPLLHAWQEDRGFRAARVRNLGVGHSSGDYVVFVDGDMVLHPMFIADHLRFARHGAYLQGGRLNASPRETQRLLSGGRARFSPLMPFAPHVRSEATRKHALRSPWLARMRLRKPRSGTIMSCNMGVWRDDLDRVNGFDEAYEGWGREDNDIAERLCHSGIDRRALRYAGLAVHLWHTPRRPPGGDPATELVTPNDRLLEATQRERRIRCMRGLDGHLAKAARDATEPAVAS